MVYKALTPTLSRITGRAGRRVARRPGLTPAAYNPGRYPSGGQLADLGVLHSREVEAEGLVALGVAGPDLLEPAVLLVGRKALVEALAGEQRPVAPLDPGVKLRRGAVPVGDGLDGRE